MEEVGSEPFIRKSSVIEDTIIGKVPPVKHSPDVGIFWSSFCLIYDHMLRLNHVLPREIVPPRLFLAATVRSTNRFDDVR